MLSSSVLQLSLALLLCWLGTEAQAAATLNMACSTVQVKVEPGGENEPNLVLTRTYIIPLQCSMWASDGSELSPPENAFTWKKEFNVNSTLDSRYEIAKQVLSADKKNLTSVLTLRRAMNKDIGNYTCIGEDSKLGTVIGTAKMLSVPLISFRVGKHRLSDVALWPGTDVSINCEVDGNPVGSVEWFLERDGALVNASTGSTMLNLTDLNYETDRGYITCKSRNPLGNNSARIFLRVKNSQAYLPPLIIIIIELVIIAVVVVAYELWMRKKRAEAGSDGEAYKVD